jgi:transposase, IS6 family
MQCTRCAGERFTKAGRDRKQRQVYQCTMCGRRITERSGSAFRGYRFPDEVIALAVRWYLRYRLSYAEVAEWLAERDVRVDPSTIYDWVRAFAHRAPARFIAAARAHRAPGGQRWRVDETYLKIGGRWRYLFRAIDEHGQIIDVYLSDRRARTAAQAFFEAAITTSTVIPTRVTTDTAKCYPPAQRAVVPLAEHRSSKYLNNGLERDHHHLKGRVKPMRRFKTTRGASRFCHGHALIRNLSRGHSSLTVGVAPRVRLATAWSTLAATL